MNNLLKIVDLAIVADVMPGTCPFDCDSHMVCSGGAGTGCGAPVGVI
ncbi:MAG TPA: hypothetical protein PL103_07035 [Saccharofermentans sp.]|nr:hypothetical protein [Saccharofermentans sp.]